MFKLAKPLFLICETPLHVGSGDNLGIVDLPIQRERHTDFPKVESSSLKGALREAFEEKAGNNVQELVKIHATFGYDEGEMRVSDETKKKVKEAFTVKKGDKETLEKEFAGCLGFTDARLLLFPVKSMKGVFAWITCPYILERLKEDLALANIQLDFLDFDVTQLENSKVIVAKDKDSNLVIQKSNQVVFEEYTYTLIPEPKIDKLAGWLKEKVFNNTGYWADKICTNLAVVSNDEFRDFVTFSTEVITRTKIDNKTGTVANGQLFTEEFLPTESVMYSLVLASPEFTKRKFFADETEVVKCFYNFLGENGIKNYFQLGGNATLGKGIVRATLLEVGDKK